MFQNNKDLKLISLSVENLDDLVDLHIKTFNGFFLTSLGSDFLKTYYDACLSNENTIALGVIDEKNKVIGFAIGALNAFGYHKKVLFKNIHKFIYSLFVACLIKPKSIFRLILNLNKSPRKFDKKNYSELMSIAVLPSLKGLGIGKLLLTKFEETAKLKGAKQCALTTDYYNNDLVIEFYKKNNYEVYYDFFAYPKRKMYKLIKKLPSNIIKI